MKKYCADLQGGLWLRFNTRDSAWYAKPCCLYKEEFLVDTDINTQFWQHPKILSERQDNLNGSELPANCRNCKITEDNNNYSRRQSWNDRLGTDWRSPDSVLEIDLQCDFSCNLACRICGPALSTLWRQVDPEYKKLETKFKVRAKNIDVLELLKTVPVHDLRQIHFQGGEPLLSNTHLQILQQLQDHIDISQVTAWYHTNGSQQVSENVLRFWEKFKSVEIYFSLDDIGTRMEYQRWPVRWNELHDTALWWRENLPHNALLNVERTVGVLNAFWLDEYEAWHEQYFSHSKFGDKISLNYHLALGSCSLDAASESYKQAILTKFGTEHWLHKTVKNIKTDNTINIKNLFNELNRHDLIRNQNWRTTYPEFLTWYPDYSAQTC